MNIDRIVMRVAGCMILASLALAYLVSPYWLFLAAFVGLNLIQASFTGLCPLVFLLRKLGVAPGPAF
jgi:hypothetical protein